MLSIKTVAKVGNTKPIYLTDVHNKVLQILEKNSAAVNRMAGTNSSVFELDWCSYEPDFIRKILEKIDIVVGADIFYEPSLFDTLAEMFRDFIRIKPSLEIVLAATMRNETTWNSFKEKCKAVGLLVDLVTDSTRITTHFHYDRSVPVNIVTLRQSEINS